MGTAIDQIARDATGMMERDRGEGFARNQVLRQEETGGAQEERRVVVTRSRRKLPPVEVQFACSNWGSRDARVAVQPARYGGRAWCRVILDSPSRPTTWGGDCTNAVRSLFCQYRCACNVRREHERGGFGGQMILGRRQRAVGLHEDLGAVPIARKKRHGRRVSVRGGD
ncbi:hypothetical protein ARMSODRAFT_955441 [Armillaria solidipes]|uniref:Uncharacterized protein n=1 Tax=Armillaria solidipes TaxID=1076256 RepID=A0A2H3C1I3_9AGAR|nr:hypothetical protein ARMSODRAFT_955441 [Armillaria solidipes]